MRSLNNDWEMILMFKQKFTMVFKDAPEKDIRHLVGLFQKEDHIQVQNMFRTQVMDSYTGTVYEDLGYVWAVQCLLPYLKYLHFKLRYKGIVTTRPYW